MAKNTVIEINNMDFSYGAQVILEDVNLAVAEGEFVCVVGPNGGGKTTLIKIILGLLKPSKGKVRVFDKSPVKAREMIGYTPQYIEYDPQFPVTVMDVVMMGTLGNFNGGKKQAKKSALEALDEVRLCDMKNSPLAELSGGQRQRAFIARGLACNPSLLILDEPTSNLDMHMETELLDLLANLNQRMTIVMVSHDIGFVSHYVKSVVCVKRKVVVHPTSKITGEMIHEIYGGPVHMVRHDHRCTEDGHECLNS